jgi:hypothetical protein
MRNKPGLRRLRVRGQRRATLAIRMTVVAIGLWRTMARKRLNKAARVGGGRNVSTVREITGISDTFWSKGVLSGASLPLLAEYSQL